MSQIENTTYERKREHLTEAERKTIERMLREGANKGQIARALFRDKSTIKREIKRGSVIQHKRNPYESKDPNCPEFIEYTAYFANTGQMKYKKHRQNCGGKNKVAACSDLVSFAEEKIPGPEKWSPDAAIGYAKVNNLYPGQKFSTKTFCNWIDDGLVKVINLDLLLKVRRKPKSPRKERKKVLGKSIEERPAEVETREEFGHWEGDGIAGKGQQGFLISSAERKPGIGLLLNARTRDDDKIVEILHGLKKEYGSDYPKIFKTVTFDNGSEFADSVSMEQTGTDVCYAHPYSSFERGTNENRNGIVRRFIPKGSSFDKLTDRDLRRINHYINTLPRKRFGYKTPLDLRREQIDAIISA